VVQTSIKKGKKTQLEGHAPSNHPKHLSNPKLKQKVATTDMDTNSKDGLQKESPTTATKTLTSSP